MAWFCCARSVGVSLLLEVAVIVRTTAVIAVCLAAGCEIGDTGPAFVIPGQQAPATTRVPTLEPITVWDTRRLAGLVENDAAKEVLSRWRDRGGKRDQDHPRRPDVGGAAGRLPPAVIGVRTLRLRYRWRPDCACGATQTSYRTHGLFPDDGSGPRLRPDRANALRGAAVATTMTVDFGRDNSRRCQASPAAFTATGANRVDSGIDRIELVQWQYSTRGFRLQPEEFCVKTILFEQPYPSA